MWSQTMRQSQVLCGQCVYLRALNYFQNRYRSPESHVKSGVAGRVLTCTNCGDKIRIGIGFIYVCGDHALPGEADLHRQLCELPSIDATE
jgi:hypothetical protein